MKEQNLKILAEGGLAVALGVALSFLSIFTMPQGGTITLAAVPLLVFALRNRWRKGLLVGLVFGILVFLLGPKYSLHPISIALDYLVPGMLYAFAGIKKWWAGLLVAYFLNFIAHVLSGVLVFASYTPDGWNVWAYSAWYNITYIVPEFILVMMVMVVLSKRPRLFK